jgi:Mg2+ and Co2+ transporter CorA
MAEQTSRKVRAATARSRRIGIPVAVASLLALAGVAQGAWRVYDSRVEDAVKDVKTEVRNLRDDVRPQWNSGGNQGAYNPYAGRQKDYDLVSGVTRDEKYGMKAKCGAEDAALTGNQLWQVPVLPDSGQLTGSQLKTLNEDICQRLIAAENRRFQQVLNTMSRIKQRNDALKRLAENRASIGEAGELDASSNNLQMSIADAQVEIQYMQATIAAYDSLIVTLKQSQDSVANIALNGKNETDETIRRAALVTAIAAASIID